MEMRYKSCCRTVASAMLTASLAAIPARNMLADTFALSVTGALASSNVNDTSVGAGTYSLQQLTAVGSVAGTASASGFTGVSLWSLLGGDSSGASDVLTSTPAGNNGKNAILRSYILATSVTGAQSIVSLGEIDPFFGGTGSVPDFVAFSGTDGLPELVFPDANASGRNVADLASLRVLAAPSLPSGAGGVSNTLALTGNVAMPGNYPLGSVQALPSLMEPAGGDVYTGVPLWTFLGPSTTNILDGYVVTGASDGYEVLFSLAELDPAYGAPADLLAYGDTQGLFPSAGFARIVIPGDNHLGRYVSNVSSLAVTAVPEPGTALLLAGAAVAACWRKRQG